MFSFSAVVIALLLVPTFTCILILYFIFPRNTLKLSEAHLFPFGLGLTLILNINRILKFAELLIPPLSYSKEASEQVFIENFVHRSGELGSLYIQFAFVPVAAFGFIAGGLYWVSRYCILEPECNACFRWISGRTNALLVNYMGQITAYSPKREALLVDILDANDSLYSGIFLDYFMDEKKLVGVRISNVIRYSFKSESDRKDSARTTSSAISRAENKTAVQNEPQGDLPYILPNNGVMFFPVSNIQNLHFWKLQNLQSERVHLDKPYRQIRYAWLLGLRYSLAHLKLDVRGYLHERDSSVKLDHLRKAFNTLLLPSEVLFDSLDVIPNPKD